MREQAPPPNQKKPKPWGSYFKEFLMLFLANSFGFFVENLSRSHCQYHFVKARRAGSDLMAEIKKEYHFN